MSLGGFEHYDFTVQTRRLGDDHSECHGHGSDAAAAGGVYGATALAVLPDRRAGRAYLVLEHFIHSVLASSRSSPVKDFTFNFLRVSAGRTFFARVSVRPSPAPDGMEVSVAPTAFEGCQKMGAYSDWAAAAQRGVRYALAHTPSPFPSGVRLLVTSILGTEVDTSADAVAAAACFATWDALGVSGAHPPRLEDGKFIFEL